MLGDQNFLRICCTPYGWTTTPHRACVRSKQLTARCVYPPPPPVPRRFAVFPFTKAMSPRAGVLSSSHVHLQHHHDGNQTHHKANSSSSEDHHPTAARPPSTSSSCSARPWPPPKPHHHHHYHHHGTRPPPQPNSHPRENTRETHGGDLSRQSSRARGGRGGLSRHLSGVRGSRSRPRATLRAVELGAEAVMGDANWVGYGVRG